MRPVRFAVIDVETTGFGNLDRIVEVAAVVIDEQGNVVDEYDTLINPERDIGPTDVHGITPSMVSAAPIFEEAAAAFSLRIEEAVLVAHNLPFDIRMLRNEFARLDASFAPGQGVCMLRLTGERLDAACDRYGIALPASHRALQDARATASLLNLMMEYVSETEAATISNVVCPPNPRTLRREGVGIPQQTVLSRAVRTIRYPTADERVLCYLDALDWALDDLVISKVEREQLEELANDLGLTASECADANSRYVNLLIEAVLRDHVVTEEEYCLLTTVTKALGVDMKLPTVTELPTPPAQIPVGTRVCFTGTAIGSDGRRFEREDLQAAAASAGLQPVNSVTKKHCDLVVAADPTSSSGKARKARDYGIPILSVGEFCEQLGMP